MKDSVLINTVIKQLLYLKSKALPMPNKMYVLFLIGIFSINISSAQQADISVINKTTPKIVSASPTDLYIEIVHADSALFNASNICDSTTYKKYFTDDLEFYHDIGGLTVSLEKEMQAFREMCARGTHIRRELVKGTLEVYPLKNYGAVEIGIHRFYHTNKGQEEKLSGTYKFIHVWQKKDGAWKISRVISYGHDDMKNE
jgi:ketosteroid isomerase-like protein